MNRNLKNIYLFGGGGGGWGLVDIGGAGVSEFFYYESKFKIKNKKKIVGGGGGGGGGAGVIDFFTMNPNLKQETKKNCFGGRGELPRDNQRDREQQTPLKSTSSHRE